jgi:hypothetical protein
MNVPPGEENFPLREHFKAIGMEGICWFMLKKYRHFQVAYSPHDFHKNLVD